MGSRAGVVSEQELGELGNIAASMDIMTEVKRLKRTLIEEAQKRVTNQEAIRQE